MSTIKFTRHLTKAHTIPEDKLKKLIGTTVPVTSLGTRVGTARVIAVKQDGKTLEFEAEIDGIAAALLGTTIAKNGFSIANEKTLRESSS